MQHEIAFTNQRRRQFVRYRTLSFCCRILNTAGENAHQFLNIGHSGSLIDGNPHCSILIAQVDAFCQCQRLNGLGARHIHQNGIEEMIVL